MVDGGMKVSRQSFGIDPKTLQNDQILSNSSIEIAINTWLKAPLQKKETQGFIQVCLH